MKNGTKTAMQELIEYLEDNDRKFTYTYNKAKKLLEKEKEQIRQSWDEGVISATYGKPINFEKYYNETYQNK